MVWRNVNSRVFVPLDSKITTIKNFQPSLLKNILRPSLSYICLRNRVTLKRIKLELQATDICKIIIFIAILFITFIIVPFYFTTYTYIDELLERGLYI
jgi:hypothetical protein